MMIRRAAVTTFLTLLGVLGLAGAAFAQSGHFVGTPACTDQGTTLSCTGKVAGLGETTFQVNVSASGTAAVECRNPGGNVAPGQAQKVTATGTATQDTPRNGQATFTVTTTTPTVGSGACPNPQWTATVTDVQFGDATVTLVENGTTVDTVTVPVA